MTLHWRAACGAGVVVDFAHGAVGACALGGAFDLGQRYLIDVDESAANVAIWAILVAVAQGANEAAISVGHALGVFGDVGVEAADDAVAGALVCAA